MSPDIRPEPVTPGPDGTPVPGGVRVIRLANEPKVANLSPEALRRVEAGQALPSFFDLSSQDKKHPTPRLSVWIDSLTTLAQAWVLVGASVNRRWVLFLNVDEVRTVQAPAVDKFPPTPVLEVEWERATALTETGERVPEGRAGWQGHAGITHLDKGNKTQRQAVRWRLADLAAVRVLSAEELAAFVGSGPTAADDSATTPS